MADLAMASSAVIGSQYIFKNSLSTSILLKIDFCRFKGWAIVGGVDKGACFASDVFGTGGC